MTQRKIEVIFGEGQASEDLLCEAIYSVLHQESTSGEDDVPDGGISTAVA